MQAGTGSASGVPSGTITLWSGAIVDIPSGWYLCDGNNGTPNLKNRFVVGAGGNFAVGDSGGYNNHGHEITSEHNHPLNGNGPSMKGGRSTAYRANSNTCQDGEDWQVGTAEAGGQTEDTSSHPLNYAYAFIMKS